MRILLCLLIILIIAISGIQAQPIKRQSYQGNEILELKDVATHYCRVHLVWKSEGVLLSVESDSSYYIVNKETGAYKTFYGAADAFNYMYREGWKFVNTLPPESPMIGVIYLLEKIEK